MKTTKTQQGISLVIVLVVLVVMMAATIAMLRNSSVGMGIAGNLGFKQNATSVGDQGIESARNWLQVQAQATLYADVPAQAYVATWGANFDPVTYPWATANNSVLSTAADGTGNAVRYVIHRMCALTGSTAVANQDCVYPTSGTNGSKQLGGGGAILKGSLTPVYRVTVRVDGPRNTVSFTQVMLY